MMIQAVTRAPGTWMQALPETLAGIVFGGKMTGTELKAFRASFGLSQREFAEIIGVTRVTVTRAERDGPSKMVERYIDLALRKGELTLSVREPVPKYGKSRKKKRS